MEIALRDTLDYVFVNPAVSSFLEKRVSAGVVSGTIYRHSVDRLKFGVWYAVDVRIDEPAVPPTILETMNERSGSYHELAFVERLGG